jgi:hypothetical protein
LCVVDVCLVVHVSKCNVFVVCLCSKQSGEDLRQDMMVLDAIHLMNTIWKSENLDLRMTLYSCIATGVDHGLSIVVAFSFSKVDIHFKLRP